MPSSLASSSTRSGKSTFPVVAATATLTMLVASLSSCCYYYYSSLRSRSLPRELLRKNKDQDEDEEATTTQIESLRRALQEAEERRNEERTGRIRAEVRLRQVSKQLQQIEAERILSQSRNNHDATTTITKKNATTTMLLQSIGTVTSPYTKRMGTPRQPQLVPTSRGYIEFTCPAATLDGIDDYSHVWIIFEFHANSNHNHVGSVGKTKIRPPRAGGRKVGQLATRSPHRPNCLGLSLVQLHAWEPSTRRLYLRGLDLVHGTPVYDIKPCVPWDIPSKPLLAPDWVTQTDALAAVNFSSRADNDLNQRVQEGRLAPLYTVDNDGLSAARQSLREILAQDPRSSHKGLKSNARGTTTTTTASATSDSENGSSNGQNNNENKDACYNLIFGQCQVFFRVEPDQVMVASIDAIDFEADTTTFVDGIPLILASEKKQSL